MTMLRLAVGLTVVGFSCLANASDSQSWLDSSKTTEERLQSFMQELNTTQIYSMVQGEKVGSDAVAGLEACAGYISGNSDMGMPNVCMGDGPAGVGNEMTNVTSFPAPVLSASTWNTSAMYDYGVALGQEQKSKGRNVVLSPTMNILRSPLWGRAGEAFSEDTWLTSRMAVAQINGIQSQNVLACAKHFAAHNQDTNRWGIAPGYDAVDSIVDKRVLHEVYFPAFKASIQEANVGTAMCSYNKINGEYACENEWLLSTMKDDWGYDGYIMSDWDFSTRSTVNAALAGLDLSMPGGDFSNKFGLPEYYGQLLIDAVDNGSVPFSRVQDMVERIWRPMFAHGVVDDQTEGNENSTARTDEHLNLAQQLVEEGSVLLKNEGAVLPISAAKYQKIAIFGADATDLVQITEAHGGFVSDSTGVIAAPLDAITQRGAMENIDIVYSEAYPGTGTFGAIPADMFPGGLNATYWTTTDYSGEINQTVQISNITVGSHPAELWESWPQVFSSQTTGTFMPNTTGMHFFSITGNGDANLYVDSVLIANMSGANFNTIVQGVANLTAGQPVSIQLDYTMGWSIMSSAFGVTLGLSTVNTSAEAEAEALAASADLSIFFASDRYTEGADNNIGLSLPGNQDDLISRLAKLSKNTIVILNTNSAILMPWIDDVEAVMAAWYSGQQVGLALERLLFGDISPSGKLTITFPKSLDDIIQPSNNLEVKFDEGLYVGYKGYEEFNITPLFPFGHGLTYTNFSLTDSAVKFVNTSSGNANVTSTNSSVIATTTIANTGSVAGKQVVQLYVSYPAAANEPPKNLKGFEKVALEVGESTEVTLTVNTTDLQVWEESIEDWIFVAGNYTFMFGFSVVDLLSEHSVYLS